jgi:MFS family permease
LIALPEAQALRTLSKDGWLLINARLVRMFAFGLLSVILALYLVELGFTEQQIGLLFTATLLGDAAVSLGMASIADRLGRRRMLMIGTVLMIGGGALLAITRNPIWLTFAATIGILSPNGAEAGPFLSIEQAALPETTTDALRTPVFAWYNLSALVAKALGALASGTLAAILQQNGMPAVESYRVVIVLYVALSITLTLFILGLSPNIEVKAPRASKTMLGLHRSRGVVMRLSMLFALDSFAGGLIIQSFIAYWLVIRFGATPAALGAIFFGMNALAGFSTLAASRIAAKVGLINTMVWTHIPANFLLISLPFMPTLPLAVMILLVRASISSMDVPTRQSYTMAVVDPDERSAAAGITSIVRSAGSALAPTLTGLFFGASMLAAPFYLAGALKIVYDLSLYYSFIHLKPPEESHQ